MRLSQNSPEGVREKLLKSQEQMRKRKAVFKKGQHQDAYKMRKAAPLQENQSGVRKTEKTNRESIHAKMTPASLAQCLSWLSIERKLCIGLPLPLVRQAHHHKNFLDRIKIDGRPNISLLQNLVRICFELRNPTHPKSRGKISP